MTQKRQKLGQVGEDIAAAYLVRQGFTVLARNVRLPEGELDIVARDGECLAFVEVRTRRGSRYGSPEESITPEKQRKLITLAQSYLQAHPDVTGPWRIDVVAVVLDARGYLERVTLIRSAVEG